MSMIRRSFVVSILLAGILVPSPASPGAAAGEEGMWPISEISKLDLAARGMSITALDILNPQGTGLINGIVQFPGCTGSFVSADGLLLTNHHCAFGAIQAASSPEKDFLKNGFLAETLAQEIPSRGFTVRITESYRDVSADVLAAVGPGLSAAERVKAVDKRSKEIQAAEEKAHPGMRAEVAEMFPGQSYMLFLYTFLRDIRLVYAPPLAVGNFGGEEDNWMWPRHTGDFSFMRAYVGPDGRPADYSAANVPYKPRVFLKVAPQGVRPGDAVVIPGYPGRTYRHMTSHYLAFEQSLRMPLVADWNAWQIDLLERMGAHDRSTALKLASRIKGLANTMKNYRGKLKGLARLDLVAAKRAEEAELQKFIAADAGRQARYGGLLEEIGAVYADMSRSAETEWLIPALRGNAVLVNIASTLVEAARERRKPDIEREAAYMDRTFAQTSDRLLTALKDFYEPADRAVLKELLRRAGRLEKGDRIAALEPVFAAGGGDAAIDAYIESLYRSTRLADEAAVKKALAMTPEALASLGDPIIGLAEALYPETLRLREADKARKGVLDRLLPRLTEVKQAFQARAFIPDANRTLRLTFGRIKGYSPADGVFLQPITTLDGVIEKTRAEEPFDTPAEIVRLWKARDFGAFAPPGFKSVPACILYDADTTGGNSGSPVLNARGELVGVNFDRAFEATINDYAWSRDYSRSIAVDIRYVLWVAQKLGRADRLMREMRVTP